MADEQLIKPRELPAATTVFADDAIMTDNGSVVGKATPVQIVNAGAPVPTEAEAIAGTDNSKRMTPLTVKQVLDNVTAPSVLRAQAWAESDSPPDPGIPGSQSAKSWAAEAERLGSEQADRAEAAAAEAAQYEGPWFNDVPSLAADTTLTYANVSVGDIIKTRDGFAYRVVAVGTSNPHIVTAGGIVLHVIPVDGAYYPLAAWGLVNDGVTDNFDKFRSAGDACRLNNIGGLSMPSGRYYLREEFVVDWQGSFYGAGGLNWANDLACTNLYFPAGTNGVRIPRANTSPSGKLGDWSRLYGFAVKCVGDNKNSTGHGIVLDARAHVSDVFVDGFPEDGFNVTATNPGKNANCFVLFSCRAVNNGRDGFYFSGADANSGSVISCDSASNGRINFNDNSFLGNGFIFCHSDAPGRRSYRRGSDGQAYRCKLDHVSTTDTLPVTGANWTTYWELYAPSTSYDNAVVGEKYYDSRAGKSSATSAVYHYFSGDANSTTSFFNCYAEGTGGQSGTSSYVENDRKTIVGGTGMSVDLPNTRGQRTGGPVRAVVYENNTTPALSSRIETDLGSRDGRYGAFNFIVYEPGFNGVSWGTIWDSANRRWNFGSPQSAGRCYELMEVGNSANLPAGMLNFSPQGVGIMGKVHTHMSAAPTSGTYRRGDRIYALNPSAGGSEGWVCTTAGVAGSTAVFKTFGSIEA